MKNKSEEKHSKFSPSAASRWINCPGSIKLTEGITSEATEYSAEGKLAHTLCEQVLRGKLDADQLAEKEGDTEMVEGFEITITDEMIESVMLYCNTIGDDLKACGFTPENYKECFFVEKTVQVSDNCYGTTDCSIAVPFDRLIVYDFKYGAGVSVNVENNYQMQCYAVGTLLDFEKASNGYSFMDTVELVIVQPRSRHKDGPVRRWRTDRGHILNWKKKIDEHIKAAKADNPPLRSGNWCRFCPAKHKCPALFDQSNELAKQAFDSIEVGGNSIVALSDEQIIKVLDNKDTIVGFLKAVESHAQTRLEAGEGGEISEKYKLVRGRAYRKWRDENEVLETFNGSLGDDIYEQKMLSPAKLEKVFAKKAGITLKEAKSKVEKYTETPEGKITIAPVYDKRPAVLVSAGDYFED